MALHAHVSAMMIFCAGWFFDVLQAVRQKNFRRVRKVIQDSLFLAKPTFLPSLMDIGAAVAEIRALPFVSANPSHLYTLPEYADLQVCGT